MKYIVLTATKTVKNNTSVMRFPFIFPNMLVHAHVAKVTSLLLSLMHPAYEIKVTSAGEINSMDFDGECHGESTTLGCKAHKHDTQLIKMNDYGSGMVDI